MRQTYKRAMDVFFAAAKESCKQSEGMTRKRLINKWFLSLQRLQRAATWAVVFAPGGVRDLGKEFAGSAKPLRAPWIAPVPWLTQDKLATIGAVAQVEPVSNARISADQLIDVCAG